MTMNDFLQVFHFDRSSGGKKCKTPFKIEPLSSDAAKDLKKNFCKKDPETGVQKQIKCLACDCRIEAIAALTQHLIGERHLEKLEKYVPRPPPKRKTLEELVLNYDGICVGLSKVEEFTLIESKNQEDFPMYKCQVFDCDGAFGDSETFFRNHLISVAHCDNFFKELGFLGHVDQDTRQAHSSKDLSSIIKIKDAERYWIQRNRLNHRPTSKLKEACSQLLAASSTSSSIHCSTTEAISSSDLSNNALGTSVVNSSSTVSSAPIINGSNSTVAQKRKLLDDIELKSDVKKAKLETKALKAKRPGFTDERYNETSYYFDCNSNLRKVYPYYFTFTTFTKGRWVGERILDVFAREFRAHPAEEYERCIKAGTLTVNYEKVDIDYRLKHNDLLANIVHRHEVPVSSEEIKIVHMDDDLVVVNKPASIPVHPCGRYRHNTVVFILAKEHGLKNLRTIHRLDRLTSGLLLFGRNPKKAREMEQQIRTRQVQKEYVCRVEGDFPMEPISCKEPIEVVSYKIGVCKVSSTGKECHTDFQRLSYNGRTSVVLCKPRTGRMHQIRVHLQYLGFPVVNDPLYNHEVFGPEKGKGGRIGKSDDQLIQDLISIHNAENWLGMDDDLVLTVKKRSETPDSPDSSNSNSPDHLIDNAGAQVREVSQVQKALKEEEKVTIATQTGIEEADKRFDVAKLSVDPHCYECKVKYRDPRPKDLVMFLHAWAYSGPDWQYRTELPGWAREDWVDPEDYS